jgi:hypothetical protein
MILRNAFLSCLIAVSYSAVFAQDTSETEDMLPDHFLYMLSSSNDDSPDSMSQNIDGGKIWPKGQLLRVCFFGGDKVVRTLIASVAPEWSNVSGLSFDFGSSPSFRDCASPQTGFSHIRIGFSDKGRWSLVGTDSTSLANQYQPSMNFSRFDQIYSQFNGVTVASVLSNSKAADRGTILHEFGHAIGLLHEHQNKNLNCWNELILDGATNVYTYYGGPPNNWSKDKVRRNLGLILLTDPGAISGAPDPKSIMGYFLPEQILRAGKNSKCYIPSRSNVISQLDKAWVTAYYQGASEPEDDNTDVAVGSLSGIPASAPDGLKDDYLSRVMLDLESDDVSIRRDARSRLADFLILTNDPNTVEHLTDDLGSTSYRNQLGVAVAISKLDSSLISDETRKKLNTVLQNSNDATLKQNLIRAIDVK